MLVDGVAFPVERVDLRYAAEKQLELALVEYLNPLQGNDLQGSSDDEAVSSAVPTSLKP